ncbi:hypothetical protein AB0G79_14630 [Streptomyces sp. NPDC020807]|uniref:hypothetical protein n=1 Tax=Streptomyces sp. NPDC020807 TaxID=3155119 RepID=UPI0033E77AEB
MLTLRTTLATLGLLAAGTTLPLTVASPAAAADCGSELTTWKESGYVLAWGGPGCAGDPLGRAAGNDPDWGQSGGGFTGSDTNQAESVVNGGTYSDGVNIVAFYDYTAYSAANGYGCLKRGMKIDNLYNEYFINPAGTQLRRMHNAISSHQWVTTSACTAYM